MLPDERERLRAAAAAKSYLSIAIAKDDTPVNSIFIPWEETANAFNMQTPKLTISKDDLFIPDVMKDLRRCELIGCYILTPLQDYSFLSSFHDIQDLFIMHGSQITDLSFVMGKPELCMFYLEDARLHDLGPLIKNCNHCDKGLPSPKCFGFYHCEIKDTSALRTAKFTLSELLIWPKEGQKERKERWKSGNPVCTFKIYRS